MRLPEENGVFKLLKEVITDILMSIKETYIYGMEVYIKPLIEIIKSKFK